MIRIRGVRIGLATLGLLAFQPSVGDVPMLALESPKPAVACRSDEVVFFLDEDLISADPAPEANTDLGSSTPAGPESPFALRVRGANTSHGIHLEVSLPTKSDTRLQVFDLQGRRLADHDLTSLAPGIHAVWIDRRDLPSGVYWARLRRPAEQARAQFVLLR